MANCEYNTTSLLDHDLPFELLSQQLGEILWVAEPHSGRFLFINDEYRRVWGQSTERLLNDPMAFLERIHPEDKARFIAAIERVEDVPFDMEYRVVHGRTDEVRWLHGRTSLIVDPDTDRAFLVGVATDITRAKRMEQRARSLAADLQKAVAEQTRELHRAKERFEAAFRASIDPLILVDSDGQVVESSPRIDDIVGSGPEDEELQHFIDFVSPEDRDTANAMWERVLGGEPVRFRFPLQHRDGQKVPVELSGVRLGVAGRDHVLLVLRDLREHVELRSRLQDVEARLAASSKLELMGQLAGGVVHDLKNMLAVVDGVGRVLADELSDATHREDAREIVRASQAAARLSKQLLHLGRESTMAGTSHVHDVVTETEPFLNRLVGDAVDLQVDVAPELPAVNIASVELEQVVMNLVVNARDAIEGAGQITVRASRAVDHVKLEITDDGCGMSEEKLSRAFEPLYTTKGAAGTGLGLSTVLRIVEEHDIRMEVDSAVGRGTRFELFLPRCATSTASADSPPRTDARPVPPLEVLAVDDTEHITHYVKRVLERRGCRVRRAESASEAIDIFDQGPTPDILVTDVHMPGASGVSLVEELRERAPELPVLFITADTNFASSISSSDVLHKPFSPGDLTEGVDRVVRVSRSEPDENLDETPGEEKTKDFT
jgi:PAS domain S-box-containing protein